MTVPPEQAEVVAYLAGLAGSAPLETPISMIFRGSDTVWKVKKAVRRSFLDFTQLDQRRRMLQREFELNAPFAPGLYRDVVQVTHGPDGFAFGDGPSAAVEWVLRMALVPEADFLDRRAKDARLDGPTLLAMADGVAAMHAGQALVAGGSIATQMRALVRGNAEAARQAGIDAAGVSGWVAAMDAALDWAAPLLDARNGFVRRAHGDLHLGNMLLWRGQPTPFDALEFDEALATIDPFYDLAFLLMDLEQRVGRSAANLVMNRYVARTGDAGLGGGLAPLLSLRAMIRAHVTAAGGGDPAALVHAAMGYLAPARPLVLAVGGLMGTGKSTLARALAPGLGPSPGALVLRSDEVRKRLHGVAPEDRLAPEAYTPAAGLAVDRVMASGVRDAAGSGQAVVADATFMAVESRLAVADAARAAGVPFLGVWLTAPLAVLEARVVARLADQRADASDADLAVLHGAVARCQPPTDWTIVDATDAAAAERQMQGLLAVL